MPRITITTIAIDREKREAVVTAQQGATLRSALQSALESHHLRFGYGTLAINGTVIPPTRLSETLQGRPSKDISVVFSALQRPKPRERPTNGHAFDLDSLI